MHMVDSVSLLCAGPDTIHFGTEPLYEAGYVRPPEIYNQETASLPASRIASDQLAQPANVILEAVVDFCLT